MLRVGVLVSGGGTNLQAILEAMDQGRITNAEVAAVISNNPGAYALERARNHGIPAECISPKDFPDRASFNEALVAKVDSYDLDLVVLAGFLVKIPEAMIAKYRNKIINIHPSLIPSFCGVGYYGLKVHEAALARGVKLRSYRSPCGRGHGFRPHPFTEGSGGKAWGYAGAFSAAGHGGGRVGDPPKSH